MEEKEAKNVAGAGAEEAADLGDTCAGNTLPSDLSSREEAAHVTADHDAAADDVMAEEDDHRTYTDNPDHDAAAVHDVVADNLAHALGEEDGIVRIICWMLLLLLELRLRRQKISQNSLLSLMVVLPRLKLRMRKPASLCDTTRM